MKGYKVVECGAADGGGDERRKRAWSDEDEDDGGGAQLTEEQAMDVETRKERRRRLLEEMAGYAEAEDEEDFMPDGWDEEDESMVSANGTDAESEPEEDVRMLDVRVSSLEQRLQEWLESNKDNSTEQGHVC